MYCKYCGKQMDDDAKFCPSCGQALYDSRAANVSETRFPRKMMVGIAACLCVGLILTALFFSKKAADSRQAEEESLAAAIAESESIAASIAESEAIAESIAEAEAIAESISQAEQLAQEESRKQYLEKLNNYAQIAEEGIGATEGICSFYCLLWYNTLFEQYDELTDPYTMTDGVFHTNVQDTFDAASYSLNLRFTITDAETCKNQMTSLLKELSDPPADLVKCYEIAEDLLDAYLNILAHAQGPYGNLSTYADKYDKYSADLSEIYQKFCVMIPES